MRERVGLASLRRHPNRKGERPPRRRAGDRHHTRPSAPRGPPGPTPHQTHRSKTPPARPNQAGGASQEKAAYATVLIMSKIGRYIATIIPPTMTPRTTIMMGSMAESSASTAASTSSS